MAYCDYTDYRQAGGSLDHAAFGWWSLQASRVIDRLTLGRAAQYADVLSSDLSAACARITDLLYQQHAKAEAGLGLAAASNDGISETYQTGSVLAAATDALCLSVLRDALGADEYGLLYRGLD